MATFSNTFTYFANTGDLNFDVSVEELERNESANNTFELALFYGAFHQHHQNQFFSKNSGTNIRIANTISIPTGVDFVEWQLKYTDTSSTGTANGIIEIANFEYEEYSKLGILQKKQTANLFDLSLDVTKLEPTSNIFCCVVSCQENMQLSHKSTYR